MTTEMIDKSGLVITMGCGITEWICPATIIETGDWKLDNPKVNTLDEMKKNKRYYKSKGN